MKGNINVGIHNRFDIEVIRDGKIIQRAQAFNVVTNTLWEYLMTTTDGYANYMQYGDGTGTPSASDSSLFNRRGYKAVTEVSMDVDNANHVMTRVCSITLGLSDAVGVTITEIGLSGGASSSSGQGQNGQLTTHAMLQDMNGNPITITKTNTDIINIYATIYCHWSVDGDNVIFHPVKAEYYTNGNVATSYQTLDCFLGRYNYFSSQFYVGVGMGNWDSRSAKVWTKSYNLANKTMTFTAPRFTESEGNIGGISHLILHRSDYAGTFSGLAIRCGEKAWSKYTVTGEAVGTGDGETTGFKTKIGLPENAKVYVNGVQQSASQVTVKRIPTDRIRLMRIDPDLSEDGDLVYSNAFHVFVGEMVFYNPDYQDVGFYQTHTYRYYSSPSVYIYVSNDLETWTLAAQNTGGSSDVRVTVPEQYRHYKYIKIKVDGQQDSREAYGEMVDNIIFATAPAVGDVITIDYDTECIPKDADHVFDATITFTFGEYQE